MKSIKDIIFKPSADFARKLALFCEPLKTHFNINHFYFHRVTSQGRLFLIGNHVEWLACYLEKEFYLTNPFYAHPCNYKDGLYSVQHVRHAELQNILSESRRRCHVNPIIQIMQKIDDGFDSYGFGSEESSAAQEALILRELPLLKMFYLRFREEFDPVIKRYEDDQVDILNVLGKSFYEEKNIVLPNSVNRLSFLNDISSSFASLSTREEVISKHIAQGYSSKEIGENLKLSKRTIEHYIENIKCKLKCDTKNQIAQKCNRIFRF